MTSTSCTHVLPQIQPQQLFQWPWTFSCLGRQLTLCAKKNNMVCSAHNVKDCLHLQCLSVPFAHSHSQTPVYLFPTVLIVLEKDRYKLILFVSPNRFAIFYLSVGMGEVLGYTTQLVGLLKGRGSSGTCCITGLLPLHGRYPQTETCPTLGLGSSSTLRSLPTTSMAVLLEDDPANWGKCP